MSNHAKHMLLGGAAVLVLLLGLRVPLGTAILYAVLLACPLMFAVMMWTMRHDEHRPVKRNEVSDQEQGHAPPPDR